MQNRHKKDQSRSIYILEKPIQLWEPKKQQCKEKAFGDDKHSFEEA
jgi:hypothetical protein